MCKDMRESLNTKATADKDHLTVGDMKRLLRRNPGWMDEGTSDQRYWIEMMVDEFTIEELAGMVWICSDSGTIDDIEKTMRDYLEEKRARDEKRRAVRRERLAKMIQKELERRMRVEREAVDLIADGDHEEARKLLDSLDDSIIKSLQERYWDLWEEDR